MVQMPPLLLYWLHTMVGFPRDFKVILFQILKIHEKYFLKKNKLS